jgi:hypothetical protein
MVATGYEKDIDLPGPRPRPGMRGTLITSAREIPASELDADGTNRLPAGVTWLPWGTIVLESDPVNCAVVYDKAARALPGLAYQSAFLVWDGLTCNTLSGMLAELWARLETNFSLGVSAALARELMTGAEGNLGLIGDATYVPAVGGAATSMRVAFNSLNMYLASKILNGTGMIHLTPGLLNLAIADYLVEWDGDVYRAVGTGHIVVGDAGHTGLVTPQGGAAGAAASPWIFATSDVWYALLGVPKHEEAETGEGVTYIRRNLDRPLMEVKAVLAFDPNILAAARVTVA